MPETNPLRSTPKQPRFQFGVGGSWRGSLLKKIPRLWQRRARSSTTGVWERGGTRGTCRLQRRSERDMKWQEGEAECRLKSQRSAKALSLSPCWLLLPVTVWPAFRHSSCHKISLWADVFDSEFGHVSRGARLDSCSCCWYFSLLGHWGSLCSGHSQCLIGGSCFWNGKTIWVPLANTQSGTVAEEFPELWDWTHFE